MVKDPVRQGDIIWLEFSPQSGREPMGHRPALVISNDAFCRFTGMAIVCPITNTIKNFPLHILLDKRSSTTGMIECEHIKSLDIKARNFKFIEKLPKDTLKKVLDMVFAEIEPSEEKINI